MTSVVHKLNDRKLITPPKFLPNNTMYETITGSVAYGVSNDTSDMDIYGFCVPPKEMLFPHLLGEIDGFGTQKKKFEQYQEHHVKCDNKEYDLTIFNIVKYFHLCMGCNPNMIDSLFTPRRCVLHTTAMAEHVRDNRDLFLSKKAWHTFKGYAYAQMSKIKKGANRSNPKRQESIDKYGYDVKFAYHVVRLMNEVEQILERQTLDLEEDREQLKSIRKGEWTLEHLTEYFENKEAVLERAQEKSTLRHEPDEKAIKQVLMECLEMHYGSLANVVENPDKYRTFYENCKTLMERFD